MTQEYVKPSQISKMERFVKRANGCKSLTIFAKRSVLDVCQVSGYACVLFCLKTNCFYSFTNNSKSKQN